MVDIISEVESDDTGRPVGAEVGFTVSDVFLLSGSGVGRGDDVVDWHEKGRAADVVFELVLTVLGAAAELAFSNFGLGSPRGYPGVAPGSENTGCNPWGSGFG